MAERIAIGRKCPTIERLRNQGKRTGNWGTAEKWFKHMNKCSICKSHFENYVVDYCLRIKNKTGFYPSVSQVAFNFAITDAFAEKVMQSIDKRIEVLDEKKTD